MLKGVKRRFAIEMRYPVEVRINDSPRPAYS
jgi:hypothetical protein